MCRCPVAAVVWWWWRDGYLLCVLSLFAATAVGAPATAENEQDDKAANPGG
jgi:hypothetical protein